MQTLLQVATASLRAIVKAFGGSVADSVAGSYRFPTCYCQGMLTYACRILAHVVVAGSARDGGALSALLAADMLY
jgi:hypothetical protein